jgi:hypothetical protein
MQYKEFYERRFSAFLTKDRDFGQLSASYLIFILCSLMVSKAFQSLVKVMCYAGTAWTLGSSLSLSLSVSLFYRLIQRYVEWSLPLGVFKTLFPAS